MTPLGTVSYAAGLAAKPDGEPIPAQPADVTQLIICRAYSDGQIRKAYQIDTDRRLRIAMDGRFVTIIERNRHRIDAAPGSTLTVTDDGPPTNVSARERARIGIEEFDFQATGADTEVDFERSRSGTTPDLSYDHMTGELNFLNGTKIAWVDTYGKIGFSSPEDNLPGEFECHEAPDYEETWVSYTSSPIQIRSQLHTMSTRTRGFAELAHEQHPPMLR